MSDQRSAETHLVRTSKLRWYDRHDSEHVIATGEERRLCTLQQWCVNPSDPYGPDGEWRDVETIRE